MALMTPNRTPSGNVRVSTNTTIDVRPATIVRVSTDGEWPYEAFGLWLDRARVSADIKNDLALARLMGMNHSSISAWKSGRQRPTTASLSKLAKILNRPTWEAYRQAGYLHEADEASKATAELPPASDWYEDMVEASKLPRHAKDALIKARRQSLAQERTLLEALLRGMEDPESE